MQDSNKYRTLTEAEIQQLVRQSCTVGLDDWNTIRVSDRFDPGRVHACRFTGTVRIGALDGLTAARDARPAELRNALIADCTIGDNVRIANIGVRLAHYDIAPGACIEDAGTLEANADAKFGNGIEIEVLNEGGGREVVLFDRLSSQFAHLVCLHRYQPRLIEQLQRVAAQEAQRAQGRHGQIGTGAVVRSVREIVDVHIGPHAQITGAISLVNGSILSEADAPTIIGAGVQARDFIVAEGARVTDAAMITTTYVGQGSRVGRQFSAEGCLLFANCEAFHGEACSVFAGPYTVTHHKSSLLIAGMFSFYNAGSGTNQSNHMYKLGPVHEGRLERGSKTGSFSYMMWPCRVGPFSVVLGKHTRAFDTGDFPFSHIEAMPDGRCALIPGFNLTTVGTVRDGAKWPARDRRTGTVKRDRISFDVFSPYTVGRMMRGYTTLKELQKKTDRSVHTVAIQGTECKRVFLRTGQKYYRRGTMMYLTEKIVARVEAAWAAGVTDLTEALQTDPAAVYSEQWTDVGGQLMPRKRLDDFCAAVGQGALASLDAIDAALDQIHHAYAMDEWIWVKMAYAAWTGIDWTHVGADDLKAIADELLKSRKEFLDAVLVDAVKEFDPLSRIGFGTDGAADAVEADFQAVRGDYDSNHFVVELRAEVTQLAERIEQFKQRL